VLENETDLAVQITSLRILDDDSGIHDVLIGLGDNGNQKVDQHNKDQELIGKPEHVNGVNGNVSILSYLSVLACLMVVPVSG
jgi:hypothetical protein